MSDLISRQAVLDSIYANCVYENEYNLTAKHIEDAVKQLPPVSPQNPKSEIETKYPDWVEAQLKILDKRIEEIYRSYENKKFSPEEALRIKRNLYELTKPYVDEKVRLIQNSVPTYIVVAPTDGCSNGEKKGVESALLK